MNASLRAFNQPKPLGGIMKQAISQVLKEYGWVIGLVLIAWPFSGLAGVVPASSDRVENHPVIRVEVYNYAQVGRTQLHEAEDQAADLFAMAGVRIVWLNHSQKGRSVLSRLDHSNADFSVRIVYAFMSKRMRRASEAYALGESTIPSGTERPTPGGIAKVFYDRVKDASTRAGLFSGQVLGDAIAHELGHLLLGVRHSCQGIMKASLASRDLQLASRGKLRFSPLQAGLLQHAALELHPESSPMVLAKR